MSMIGNYYMIDEEIIKKIRQGELLVENLIYDENDDVDEEKSLDIDKAWHAIHFTLTGEIGKVNNDDVLCKIVLSGNLVNDEDVGYGPAHEITSDEVKKINLAIKDMSEDDFRSRFNFQKMVESEVYPISEGEDEGEFFEYIWYYFDALKVFFAKASESNSCILSYLN